MNADVLLKTTPRTKTKGVRRLSFLVLGPNSIQTIHPKLPDGPGPA